MEDPKPIAEIATVLLDQVKVGVRSAISMEFVRDNAVVEAEIDRLADRMAFQLQSRVLAEALPPEQVSRSKRVEFEVPSSWWQHFKADHRHRWWLRWLTTRRPVRTETLAENVTLSVSLQRYWAYPEAKAMPVDRFGSPVRIHLLDTDPFSGVGIEQVPAPRGVRLILADDGPGSRREIAEYIREVIEERTMPGDDTTAERLAQAITTSVLSRLGAGYSVAARH